MIVKKKKRELVDFAVPADRSVKMKENQKKKKKKKKRPVLSNLVTKMLWDMKVTTILIVTGPFGMIPKSLKKVLKKTKIGGLAETIQTTALLKSSEY